MKKLRNKNEYELAGAQTVRQGQQDQEFHLRKKQSATPVNDGQERNCRMGFKTKKELKQ